MRQKPIIIILLTIFFSQAGAQNLADSIPAYNGLRLAFGTNAGAITDNYISNNKYSGTLQSITLSWSKIKDDRAFNFSTDFSRGEAFQDHEIANLSAEAGILSTEFSYYYLLSSPILFNKKSHFYLGPGFGTRLYAREQNIALGGSQENELISLFLELPTTINFMILYKLSPSFDILLVTKANVLSAGIRSDADDDFVPFFLSGISAFHSILDLTLQYKVQNRVYLFTTLRNRFTRVEENDLLLNIGSSGIEFGLFLNVGRARR